MGPRSPAISTLLSVICVLFGTTLGEDPPPPPYPPPPPAYPSPPPPYPPPSPSLLCLEPSGLCLDVPKPKATFPEIAFDVRAVGFETSQGVQGVEAGLSYEFGFIRVNHTEFPEVPETAQVLIGDDDKLLISPRDAHPNRTLVALNGPGNYTAYVCAVDGLGGQACAHSTLTVHPPCSGEIPELDMLQEGLDFAPALASNDTHTVLELAYTLAAARNAVGSHAANLTEGQDLILPLSVAALDDAVSALSVVLNFENISSSTAIAVLNAQRALLGPIEGISSEVEPAQEDLCAVDLPAVCPRSPGFWSNWPEVWDADRSNDDRFSGHTNFPESDILLPPYYHNYTAEVGLLIGDFNRNGVADDNETTLALTLEEARDALSPGGGNQGGGNQGGGNQGGGNQGGGNQGGGNQGGGNQGGGNQGGGNQGRKLLQGSDRRPMVQRFLVAAWLSFLANAQPPPPEHLVHEAIRWLNATAGQTVAGSDDAWSGCDSSFLDDGTRCGELIKDDLDEYSKAEGCKIEGSDTSSSSSSESDNTSRRLLQTPAVDLPAVCPRSPGFWSNWPEVWDADLSNDDRFSGHSNFPESDILLPPYYENYTAEVGLLIGDFNRNGVADDDETTLALTLEEARDALSPGGGNQGGGNQGGGNQGGGNQGGGNQGGGNQGGGNQGGGNQGNGSQGGGNQGRKLLQGSDRRPMVQRFLVNAWLNFLANAQPPPPEHLVHEAIRWLNATAGQTVAGSDDAWSGCDSSFLDDGTRCGEQIKDDLEATFATCAEASPLPSAYPPPPCPPPPPPVRQPSLGDLAAMCLQNTEAALAQIESSEEDALDTLTASNALDSAYTCALIQSAVSDSNTSINLRRLASEDEQEVLPAEDLRKIIDSAGRQLGAQVPPNATLVTMGSEVVLGASMNADNSMAGAYLVIPGISLDGQPGARFPNAVWCLASNNTCSSQDPLSITLSWTQSSQLFTAGINAWSNPMEDAFDYAAVSGVLQVQAHSSGSQATLNSTLVCEEGLEDSDDECLLQLQLPVQTQALDPSRPTACARLQPSFPSTTNATLSYTAIVESSVPLEASSMPGTLACNTSQLGAYLLVQFSLPTPSPSPPMPSPPLPSPPTPSTPESPLETDPDGLPTIRLNANVQEDFDEVTATEESEREFKQDLRGGLADNLCDEDGANQSSLQGEGEECVESIQIGELERAEAPTSLRRSLRQVDSILVPFTLVLDRNSSPAEVEEFRNSLRNTPPSDLFAGSTYADRVQVEVLDEEDPSDSTEEPVPDAAALNFGQCPGLTIILAALFALLANLA